MEENRITAWPHLVVREIAVGLFVTSAVIIFCLAVPLGLLPPADPSTADFSAKAPWFFVGLQEMLYHLPPLYTASVIPILAIAFLLVFPYLSWRDISFARLASSRYKWLLPLLGLSLAVTFEVFARIPFHTQAVLTALFTVIGTLLTFFPSSRLARIQLIEFVLAYMVVSYGMWTFIGFFLRNNDWSWVTL